MEKFDGVVTLWEATDAKGYDSTRIEFDRNEAEGNWQISLEDGPFSGYPTINLDRARLVEFYDALEKELFPERFMVRKTPTNRVKRLMAGDVSFGCAGRHVGTGAPDCPFTPHHHHDEFCNPPTVNELQEAGVDPLVFREKYYRKVYNETGLA